MRIIYYSLLLLITGYAVGSNGFITNVINEVSEWWKNYQKITRNVHILVSPNVFEMHKYNLGHMADIIESPKFNQDLPTVIYIHGWLSNGELDESVMAVRSAYRDKNAQNFIAIDWSYYAHWRLDIPIPYFSSMKKLKLICEAVAEQLELVRKRGCPCYKNIYLVGHSLGGQCAGLIGRHLKKISNNEFVLPRIYALDPAGPNFEKTRFVPFPLHVEGFDCISKSDADYVQIIHTSAGDLGINNSVGHSDFYPNGGTNQPGCKYNACNHRFAWIFYQQSVREGVPYLARKCDSYSNFENGQCNSNEIRYMGYSSNETLPMGTFYLKTHQSKFGSALGIDGIRTKDFSIIFQNGTKVPDHSGIGFRSIKKRIEGTQNGLFDHNLPLDKYNAILKDLHDSKNNNNKSD